MSRHHGRDGRLDSVPEKSKKIEICLKSHENRDFARYRPLAPSTTGVGVTISSAVGTDIELLDRWRAGDPRAGNSLFQRHFDSISRFFENKLDQDIDELIQSTFYALVRNRDQFKKKSSFRTYLFTIARHELYRYLRNRRRDGQRLDFAVTSLMDLQTTPTGRMMKDQERAYLLTALRSLPLEQQLIIEFHYWEDIGFNELATIFDIAPATARTRLFRARRALRARLQELSEGGTPGEEDSDTGQSDEELDAWARDLRARWDAADDDEPTR